MVLCYSDAVGDVHNMTIDFRFIRSFILYCTVPLSHQPQCYKSLITNDEPYRSTIKSILCSQGPSSMFVCGNYFST